MRNVYCIRARASQKLGGGKMDSNTKITVIGGGNGGFATAADLKVRGFDVTLFEFPEFKQSIQEIMELGGINLEVLESTGLKGGFAKLDKITVDMEEALADADVIFVIVPAFGQDNVARNCAPYLKDNQLIVLEPGNFGGSISFFNELKQAGCNKNVIIAETDCMIYATRKKDATTTWIRGYKQGMGLSAFPSINTDIALEKIRKIYPTITKRNNVLETGMSNPNTIAHVPIMLFNLGMIDNKMDVLMYHTAFSKSIGKIVAKLDEDRLSVNKSNVVDLKPMSEVCNTWYAYQGAGGDTLQESNATNPIYAWSKLPKDINHRYITEDVPYGLIPMCEFLEKFGGECSHIKAVLDIADAVSDKDLHKGARSLSSLKIDSFDSKQLNHYLTYGE